MIVAGKISVPLDKARWRPSILPQLITVVSTCDADGRPNFAPESWITMVAFQGPIIGLGCHVSHKMFQNIEATQEFVINIPGELLAEKIWALPDSHGDERLAQSGWTLTPAFTVAPPLIAECLAHMECVLTEIRRFGDEVFLFARIQHVSLDETLVKHSEIDPYAVMRMIFYLEERTYGIIDAARRIDTHCKTHESNPR